MQKSTQNDAASAELIFDLQQAVQEVASDKITRLLYSTDASIYQIMPVGVIWPRDKNEVTAVVEIARKHNTPVLPRGGGTSLAGQAIGKALILDFSRHMDQVLDLNPEQRTVTVQPGVVLGPLNRNLKGHGLMFGPDPASADRATLGGVIGNNATGAHSILYGMVHDHLLEIEVVLSDASQVNFKAVNKNELKTKGLKNSREGDIYRALPLILDQYQEAISTHYPDTFRNVAGYNLKALAQQQKTNPAVLLAGSEGTLGIITSAKLNLVAQPENTFLYLVHFPDLKGALESVPAILETNPSAVELIDRMLIQLAKANPAYRSLLSPIQGDPAAVLAVEYQGEDARQLSGKDGFLSNFGFTIPLPDKKQQDQIWKARKVGLGILQSTRGDAKPITFIEDAAVPVKYLASYALEIKRFANEIGVGTIAFYAHASAGCLHIRPQVNLKNENGLKQMRLLAEKSLELVLKFGGTTSGEHGEGIARGEFMKRLYGPELTEAFRKVKETFDPDYLFNPGKIIDPPPMDSRHLLRYGPDYSALHKPQKTLLDFQNDQGFDRAVEMCNGAGVCRQLEGGVMCPSFQASRDEKHSTRGRANLLRAAMTGKLGPEGMASTDLYAALDLCLSCQACMYECPSTVDMSKLKAEFLYQYYQVHGIPIRNRIFANIAQISKLVQPFSFLANPVLKGPARRLLSVAGIHPEREMPPFARETFTSWYGKQYQSGRSGKKQQVVFFHDTYLEYNYPHIGRAAVKIFEKAGLDLIVLKEKVDSGRPAFSKGLLDKARKLAVQNLEILAPYAEQGIPIVGCEPSVVVMLKKEYRDLVPGSVSDLIAESALMVEGYLVREIEAGKITFQFDDQPRRVLYHGHCQQKANFGTEDTLKLLGLIPGCRVEEIEAGCCGMAGAFGYEKEHYQFSLEIAELELAPRVREADPEVIICASGTSCREQILHTTDREAIHPLELFARALL
jgi:FAD/FMN-containing dehydrogenase/Fe-S oxidoreductase